MTALTSTPSATSSSSSSSSSAAIGMTSSECDVGGSASSSAGRASLGFRLSCPVSSLLLPCHLLDVDVLDKTAADSEYRRQRIPHYEGERCVLDGGFQAQARQSSVSTQTQPVLQRPAVCQYEQQRMPEQQREAEMQSDAMLGFLCRALPELQTALLKNEAMDVFKDQLQLDDDDDDDAAVAALTAADTAQTQAEQQTAAAAAAAKGRQQQQQQQQVGARPGHSPSLFHSFHHLLYSRQHSVGWLDWHPARCCVAFSLIPSWSFDQWCEHSGEVSLSYILLYDLTQLLQPYAIVKVPGVVTAFRFHPTAHLLPAAPAAPATGAAAAPPPPLLPAAAPACTPLIAGLQTGQIILYQIPNVPSSAAGSQRQAQAAPQPQLQLPQQHKTTTSSSPSATPAASPSSVAAPAAAPAAPPASSQSSFLSSLSSSPSDGSAFLPSPLYALLSNLDRSHGRPVSDLHWMPACQQINRKGERLSGAAGLTGCSSQLVSFAADGKLLFWDYRQLNEAGQQQQQQQQQQQAGASSFPSSHYAGSQDGDAAAAAAGLMSSEDYHEKRDGKWSPLFSLPLQQPAPGQAQAMDGDGAADGGGGGGESGASTDSQQAAALAVAVNSQVRLSSSFPVSASTLTARRVAAGPFPSSPLLLSVTEDGEVLEIDTSARAAAESHGSGAVGSVLRRLRVHSTVGVSIDRSCVLPSLYVSCGESTFALCQVGDELPVFVSPPCPPACSYLTARCSPTRPAVLCLARSDGVIEIWDCLDQTHTAAFLFPTGSADALLSLSFAPSGSGEAGGGIRQYLACGDSGGKCHIIEIPRALRRRLAGEEQAMLRWLDRERQRGREAQRRLLHKSRAGPLLSALTPYQQQMLAHPRLFHTTAAAATQQQQTEAEAANASGSSGLPGSSTAASSNTASSSSSGGVDAAAEGEYAAVSAAALASLAAALKEAEAGSVSQ